MADAPRLALAIQQPWAEMIVRGEKRLEIRSRATNVRGTIYVYASRRFSSFPDAASVVEDFLLDADALPRGLVVGTVEIVGCRRTRDEDAGEALVSTDLLAGNFAYRLENPRRLDRPRRPDRTPYGVWFEPFERPRDRG